jgi:hypothetical protein
MDSTGASGGRGGKSLARPGGRTDGRGGAAARGQRDGWREGGHQQEERVWSGRVLQSLSRSKISRMTVNHDHPHLLRLLFPAAGPSTRHEHKARELASPAPAVACLGGGGRRCLAESRPAPSSAAQPSSTSAVCRQPSEERPPRAKLACLPETSVVRGPGARATRPAAAAAALSRAARRREAKRRCPPGPVEKKSGRPRTLLLVLGPGRDSERYGALRGVW